MKIPRYDPKKVEAKWQRHWLKNESYRADLDPERKKFYALVEFPFPSGDGLHTGHIRGYTAMDIIARKRRFEGYNVLFPIGWDAFGLPTENYAIKTGLHPAKVTKQNTDIFRKQLRSVGLAFDWSREINTTDPEYYRWTQWIFLQLFKKGLAYKAKMEINWCPSCKIGLANEEVIDGTCERCGHETEKREKEQWMLAITQYADRLDRDLDTVDYWEKIKVQQRNWIGRSEGTIVKFKICESKIKNQELSKTQYIEVFTTRVDTIFGCTYVVVAPEHGILKNKELGITNQAEIQEYLNTVKKETERDRMDATKEKTGVKVEGIEAVNPFTGESVPIFVADYVLGNYGTGAVMAVPAHDERDFEFAKKYGLPMKISIAPFFCDIDSKDAVRQDVPTVRRKTAFVLLKHWNEDKYLCLDWEKFGWHSGIIGGIEEGEDPIDAAMREIVEETGYKNPEFVKYVGQAMHTNFYAAHKNVNRYADGVGMLFRLKNDFWEQPKEEEIVNHRAVWIDGDKMETFLNLKNFQYMWGVLIAGKECFTDDGVLVNSNEFSDLKSGEAREKMTAWLEERNLGKRQVNFKLRDWVFSRQRYWGEPIPMVNCAKDGWVPLPESELPLKLPKVKSYTPTDTGESPLAAMTKWVKTKCPVCGGKATRETDTMPNWAGSSWYYLRYTDPKNTEALASKEALKYWTPTDWYNGGMEHTTLHLLYSRFWHKFLFDIGAVPTSEPYQKRTSHGLILAEGGVKMSKSKGNVVNPDSVVRDFGADTLRVYEMFMGPFDQPVAWSMESISGSRRFLEKVWKLQTKIDDKQQLAEDAKKNQNVFLHQTIKKVSEDIEAMRFNTAISSLMIFANEMEKQEFISKPIYLKFLILLSPFAPHIAEEIWQNLGNEKSIFTAQWPQAEEQYLVQQTARIILQVNGKLRASFEAATDADEATVRALAEADDHVAMRLKNTTIRKVIFVQNRLINFVVE